MPKIISCLFAQSRNKAQHEIFITDWWFTPELYLKRPLNIDNEEEMIKFRLDSVLHSMAEKGIKIFVLLWKEVEIAGLYNASLRANKFNC